VPKPEVNARLLIQPDHLRVMPIGYSVNIADGERFLPMLIFIHLKL